MPTLDPWYKVADLRKEVREGRSFDPNEFAIALEQVLDRRGPRDYWDPQEFFARTCFTRALREHLGIVLRRLSGETQNAAPVLTLITQFGGGKTHTLTALYHLVKNAKAAAGIERIKDIVRDAGLSKLPAAEVAVFVGNAWDPGEGRETPWIDVARQLAGQKGVDALGPNARTTPPGTKNLAKVFDAAGGSVLVLFDEVLNFLNRHRGLAESFHAFIQNLTVAMTGAERCAAMISLPRSQVEMTDWDRAWQEKITKVVHRVARDLIVTDESEISEVIARRLFEDLGPDKTRKAVARAYADWCFERRAQLPPEWTVVDSAATEAKARDYLRGRFEACYPFHPATLSVFQRKWQALPQYQQTRGTLAMLAQWVSLAAKDAFAKARREPLITLGSGPLDDRGFQSTILGQLGEPRLSSAIDADVAAQHSHARALDADAKGPLRDVHQRVAKAILFESSGGQGDKAAHLPELRFALGDPDVDTTSIDNAATAIERRGYYIRKVGTDGFKFGFTPTLKKVVSDRRASLDEDEVQKATLALVKREFEQRKSLPVFLFPEDGAAVQDSPKLTVVVLAPDSEWRPDAQVARTLAEWTTHRGKAPRLYPGALVWSVRRPGRDLRDKVELWLAWKRVERELQEGTLGGDFDRSERAEVTSQVRTAEDDAVDEVWGAYRYLVLADKREPDGLHVIDLGAGHAQEGESLTGRVLATLKSQALLNESPGAGYIERKWPEAFKESAAWPLGSLRQAFLTGAMERLVDVDAYLKSRVPEFVARGDFGLASGRQPDGTYQRLWFKETVTADEVTFDADVYLVTKARAAALSKPAPVVPLSPPVETPPPGTEGPSVGPGTTPPAPPIGGAVALRLAGTIPSEVWNLVGRKLIPKLKSAGELQLRLECDVSVDAHLQASFERELRQILIDLGLADSVTIRRPQGQE